MRRFACGLFAFLALGMHYAASAQNCTVGMPSIDFGTVNAVDQGESTAVGSMSVNCSGASTPRVRVCIALGAPVDMSWDPRYLVGPSSQRLEYNIYSDAGYQLIWGSAYSTAGEQVAVDVATPGPGYSGSTSRAWYAKVPVQNDPLAGRYTTTFAYATDAAVRAQGYYGTAAPACSQSMTIVSRFEFGVGATVASDCAVSATPLDFGPAGIALATTPITANGTVSVRCTRGVSYTVALNAGQGAGATVAQRKLTRVSGTQTLLYRLYRDGGRGQLWGDGSAGTNTVAATGAGIQTTTMHTVYGTLQAQTVPPTGQYSDTITVTVTY